jgi:hypothetical protein
MLNFRKKILSFMALFLLLTQVAISQDCLTNEQYPNEWQNSRYSVHNDGTVTDTKTQLMWKVCSEGQLWNAGACEDTTVEVDWQTALQQASNSNFANHTDWRVPNVKELQSIVAFNCLSPSINTIIFPNTAARGYWSSSPYANDSISAWRVYFNYGNDYGNYRGNSDSLRLVRSGQ